MSDLAAADPVDPGRDRGVGPAPSLAPSTPSSQPSRRAISPFAVPATLSATAAAIALWWLVRGTTGSWEFSWVAGLDLEFVFAVNPLSALLTLIVTGIGAGVFVYASGYFSPGASGTGRFAVTLTSFAASMVGLVLADSIWTLFVFWELTSVTSFLLVGHKYRDAGAQRSARRALLITAAGGLVLLAGLLVLGDAAGTTRLSEFTAIEGTSATVAAVLVVIAAATKSAQVPFHVWLPGAMAAPTPVSAYLHSATMVKAGVILVAVVQPALVGVSVWTPIVMGFGLVSMLWGAIGALRQTDAKLILAWGTVSQLGLMIALLSVADGKATFAAVSILVAHAVFKAALFMLVGEIDVRTGTRDIAELGGLARAMPLTFMVALASGASMAGVPPLLGFAAKEAGIEAALGLDGADRSVLLIGVVVGSVLTVAYTTRLLVTVFGGDLPEGLTIAPPRRAMSSVMAVLGAASVVGYVLLGQVADVARDAAVVIAPAAEAYTLLRWPGLTTAFVTSAGIVVVGAALGAVLSQRSVRAARPIGAELVDASVDGTLRLARVVAARVQHGSLPVYMATVAVVVVIALVPFAVAVDGERLVAWDEPIQVALAAVVLLAALGMMRVPNRLGAAIALGAVGFGVAGLFAVHGAPDLALTQLLVETVVVVGFVVALGPLGVDFPRFGAVWRNVRLVLAGLVGVGVAVALAASAQAPAGAPPLERLADESIDTGGGNNIVNVILTDIRALDTWGEVVVLAVVALGVVSLARAGRADRSPSEEVAS